MCEAEARRDDGDGDDGKMVFVEREITTATTTTTTRWRKRNGVGGGHTAEMVNDVYIPAKRKRIYTASARWALSDSENAAMV